MEKEPERRYQQVSQIKTSVETILQTAPQAGAPTPSNVRTPSRAGGQAKLACIGVVTGMAGLLAIWFCWHLLSGTGENIRRDLVKPVSATTAYKGDIGVYLNSLATVDSSNSVFFQMDQKYCQEVIKKFDARQAFTVEADTPKGKGSATVSWRRWII